MPASSAPSKLLPSRPNIVWISLEDTSPRLGCYGDPVARTPNIDRLAAEGMLYRKYFSTAPVCGPSRSSIITGMYPTSIGAHHMRTSHTNPSCPELPTPYETVPPPHVKPVSEYLRAAGYFCTNNIKTDYQFAPPLTAWDEHGPEAHWSHRPDPGQPFFAVFSEEWTHESGMWENEDNAEPKTDPALISVPPWLPDSENTRRTIARHYDNIARADAWVGELLRELDEAGLKENTLVFLWSDHGEGLPRAKRWPYDSGIRVPLIIRGINGIEPGTVSERLVSNIDLGPTILSLSGTPIPCHMQGQAFLGPKRSDEREYIYAARDRYDESYDRIRAVRDKRYKYLRHYYPNQPYLIWIPYRNRHPVMRELWEKHRKNQLTEVQSLLFRNSRPPEEFYDTVNDPHELNNLANDPLYRKHLHRMSDALDDWITLVGDLGEMTESQMVERMWPGGKQPITAAPVFIPIDDNHIGKDPVKVGEGTALTVNAPALIQFYCATQGASMAWKLKQAGDSPPAHWQLFTGPLKIDKGQYQLEATAIRIGYKQSAVKSLRISAE